MSRPDICIWDIDSTIANPAHRLHFLEKSPKDWDSFLDGIDDDASNRWAVQMFHSFKRSGIYNVFLTGRKESFRSRTVDWLFKHVNGIVHHDIDSRLFMRANDDFRKAVDFKESRLAEIRELGDIILAIDDQTDIAMMYRRNGIPCLQCAHWDMEGRGEKFEQDIKAHFNVK